jgi:putative transposase
VTVCSFDKHEFFGQIAGGEVVLSPIGRIVHAEWLQIPTKHPTIRLDQYVVMPNHIHGLLVFAECNVRPPTLPIAIQQFKIRAMKSLHAAEDDREAQIWQRSYNERVVRNADELKAFREYIRLNPSRWDDDEFRPGPRFEK